LVFPEEPGRESNGVGLGHETFPDIETECASQTLGVLCLDGDRDASVERKQGGHGVIQISEMAHVVSGRPEERLHVHLSRGEVHPRGNEEEHEVMRKLAIFVMGLHSSDAMFVMKVFL